MEIRIHRELLQNEYHFTKGPFIMHHLLFGLFPLPIWGYILVVLGLTHLTIIAVTLYLHRCQSHRALDLHPLISHPMRLWLWLTTGMRTTEWVTIHRKHHAHSDRPGDPHSPIVSGLGTVFWRGTELYRDEALNKEELARYSHGTPNDWLERHLYHPHNYIGITIMYFIDVLCFGLPGISIWAIQMLWIPFFAAGVVNGIGHFFGYRNFECPDNARNISPIGFLIGGEELHNNHHTYGTSAKMSVKWWEFDLGWFYITVLRWLRLAHVKKVPPKPARSKSLSKAIDAIDINTIREVFRNRFQVMSRYSKKVTLPILQEEKRKLLRQSTEELTQRYSQKLLRSARKLLTRESSLVDERGSKKLLTLREHFESLNTVYEYRLRLQAIWEKTTATQKELTDALQEWCRQAETSGIKALQEFADYLRSFNNGTEPSPAR